MQIKRFEAADMTEALRMVKREFGDDAVILSAKQIRSGGFFSALRIKSVEISAAIDYPDDDARDRNEFSELLTKQLDTELETDRVSLSSPLQTIKPFARKAGPFSHQPPEPENNNASVDRRTPVQEQGQISDGVKSQIETRRFPGASDASMTAPTRSVKNDNLVAVPFYRNEGKQHVIALVGPSGVGKSTTVAKLAWHCSVVEKKRTGLISLDRFRIDANSMLERVAGIMNLSLTIAHDADQLRPALEDLADADVVLIDTPGMSGMDPSMMHDVCALLRLANPDETHLVSNATVRDDVFAATVKTFSSVGVNRLIFTHMDEHIRGPAVLNLLKKVRLSSSFYGDGVDLFDDLQETTADGLAGFSPHNEPSGGQVTAFSSKRGQIKTGSGISGHNSNSIQYVANWNSELFHHPNCKSVKWINAENIAAFNSIEHAIGEGFKPCRACCDIGEIRKPVAGALVYQRASTI